MKGRSRKRAKLAAACLTLGLATAWGAPSEAAVIRLEVTPVVTINNAWALYFTKNSSSATIFSMGTFPGGQTSIRDTDFPGFDVSDFDGAEYALVGVYDDGQATGVSVSAPNDSLIIDGTNWEDSLGTQFGNPEEETVASLLTGSSARVSRTGSFRTKVEYGVQATIVNFSVASFGGTAIATVVPEPATWVLLVTGAGVLALAAKRRTG